ncbi:Putative major facilitator, sugar transporter, major facilitator superfamily [Colletotrichum destructivum]|uniref:Major facilitator, sugar transporter, major facilitator superfamily n=1 Tax=Colletotrichum destructivum TaxID=34406 RepID=A0AAX4I3R4_9PEZI|nr:Putative major facilitator, sugar transporter, major facilitator superfamily [Colletotrichum destructivum]
MGFLKGLSQKKPKGEAVVQAQAEAPDFEKVDWIKDPGLRKLYFYAFVLCIASATTGYDGMFFNSVQNFSSWQEFFDHPKGGQLGLLSALYQIGSLVSIPMVPWVADNFGRRIPIIIGCVIMVAGAILQGACQNLGMFMGGRVLLGFGNSFAQIASPALLSELAHPQHRARLTTVYNCLWNVGALIVAWLSFGTDFLGNEWSWRIPAIGQAVPSVVQLLFIFWVPESPRFLIAKDRHDEALNILGKYHANGNNEHPTVQFEFREIRETIKREVAAKNSSSYLDFFRTPGNKYRFIVLISLGLFSQWSGNAIISNYTNILYTNAGIESSTARLGLSAGQTGLSLIVSLTLAMQVDRFGRRPIFLASTGGMLMTFVFWTLSAGLYEEHGSPGSNYAMIFFIWLFGFFYAFAWSGLLISYSIEILPYKLRAKGLMIVNLTVQAALTLNNYANPYAFEHFEGHTWKLYLIYTGWIFLELTFVYFFYVETKGPTLEELAKVIDGPDAEVADLDLAQIEQEVKIGHEAEEFEHKRG